MVINKKTIWTCHLAILILLSSISTACAFQQDLRFQRFSLNEGLSQSSILCMLQDSKGFMWFGTYDGLNRYDGRHVKIYTHTKNTGSISDGNIRTIYEDSSGLLWVGTGNGLNYYDRKTDSFKHFLPKKDDPNSISGKTIRSIFEDSKGHLWIGTNDGLNLLDRTSGKFTRFKSSESEQSISFDEVRAIFEDMSGNLWVGTAIGLNRYDETTGAFKRYLNDSADKSSLCDDTVLSFYQEKKEELWIGTKKGIALYDYKTDKFKTLFRSLEINDIYKDKSGNLWLGTLEGLAKRNPATAELTAEKMQFKFYKKNQFNPQSLSDNKVTKIIEDQSGVIWIGTYGDGLSILTPKMQAFKLISHQPWKNNTIAGMEVSAVLEDKEGLLWIGTYKNGLSVFNPETEEYRNYNRHSPAPWNLNGDRINCIFQDKKGQIWVGTRKKGVFVIDKENGIVARYRRDKKNDNSLSQDNIWWIYEGSKGFMWIGTSKKGLNRLNPETGEFKRYNHSDEDPNSLGHRRVRNIFEDSNNNFWIGTNAGLNLMDREKGTFKHFKHDPDNPNSISNNRVTPIAEAADGSLWLGTDSGLNRFDRTTGKFTRYTEKDGLNNDGIQGLCIDAEGKIWVSTFSGISMLDPTTGKIWNFGLSDGLQGIEFWINSYNKGQSGNLYFGGLKGLNAFNPRDIKINPTPPPVVITDLTIMNSPAKLETNITDSREITLSWQDAMFTFSFAALDYQNPRLNKYKYRLEGFDDRWIETSGDATATFTNFDHGSYVFRVIGSNSDGVWNETGTKIKVKIIPPFWKTWWFAGIIAFLALLCILLYVNFRIHRIRKQREKLARQVKEKTADLSEEINEHKKTEQQLEKAILKAKEANHAKSAFLASMSHEIRTPLNSIIGVAELLKNTSISEEQAEYVNIFESSGEILLSIINDILDFSKIEANHVTLEKISINLLQEMESIMSMQTTAAIARNIDLVCRYKPEVPEYVIGDPTRIRQIIINVISNAVKFTSSGEVCLTVARDTSSNSPDNICFTITDTGVGIEKSKLESIFAPFSQADTSTTRKFGGTGLGLSISKKLTELMGGTITATSVQDKGSSFSITIPLPRDHNNSPALYPDLDYAEIIVASRSSNTVASICETLNYYGATTTPCSNPESLRALLQSADNSKYKLLIYDLNFTKTKNTDLLHQLKGKGIKLPALVMMQKGASFDKSRLDAKLNSLGITMPPSRGNLMRSVMKQLGLKASENFEEQNDKQIQLPPLKVLLAEDNASNRELIRHFLKKTSASLSSVSNGEEALKMSLKEKYDIILMDMEMPVMDGYTFLEKFREQELEAHGRRTGVIALTAHAAPEFKEKCLAAGADEFISKPIKQANLLDRIVRLHTKNT